MPDPARTPDPTPTPTPDLIKVLTVGEPVSVRELSEDFLPFEPTSSAASPIEPEIWPRVEVAPFETTEAVFEFTPAQITVIRALIRAEITAQAAADAELRARRAVDFVIVRDRSGDLQMEIRDPATGELLSSSVDDAA